MPHCCQRMESAVASECSLHPDRFDCPDALLVHSASRGTYGLIVHDGGRSSVEIAYCPFCGASLRSEKTVPDDMAE